MGKPIYKEINGKKICTGCHKDQPIGMYGIIKKRNGKHVQKAKCTDCLQQATEYWRNNHRDRYMEYRKQYYKNNLEKLRYKHYIADAIKRSHSVEISQEEFISLFNQPCLYCGAHEVLNGVDRLDNANGYIPGNVAPCCAICNVMKRKMFKEQFLSWIRRIAFHQGYLNTRRTHA